MATTMTYNASMCTRKKTSSSNSKSSAASQEYYTNDYNYVGIINFPDMALANKVITAISLRVTAAKAGYGASTSKTVYVRKSNYQVASKSGITGGNYYGDALGTFSGSFYGNTTTNNITGTLFDNLAAYIQAGNNTICLYNPNPQTSSQGYAKNYLQWDSAKLTVTYEEGISQPTTSQPSVEMGTAVTIQTNRLSTDSTHTISYAFGNASGVIATGVGDSVSWTPPVSLATQIPSSVSGVCTITCKTYYGGTLVGTRTTSLTLGVPASVVPTIGTVTFNEAVSGLAAQFAGFVQNKSKLAVTITAAGAQGSSIKSYRTSVNGASYTASSFTTNALTVSGSNTMTVTVTDFRGRTATVTRTFTVLPYSPPALTGFSAERCNAANTAAQLDGNKVRITANVSASAVNGRNTLSCKVSYKRSTASTWTLATSLTATNYTVSQTNLLLSPTFDPLYSYDLKLSVTDYFQTLEQTTSIGTKQVMMDFYRDGSGIAFGKNAELENIAEFAWKIRAFAGAKFDDAFSFNTDAAKKSSLQNLGGMPFYLLSSGTSFDTLTESGFFGVKYSPPAPVGNWGVLLNVTTEMTGTAFQMYFPDNQPTIYKRWFSGGAWGSWSKVGVLDAHPVGSIYISVNSTSPATLFGGTWVRIQDVFMLAAGSSHTAGSTGGEAEHTLTESEIPEHEHTIPNSKTGGTGTTKWVIDSASTRDGHSSLVGGNSPHNNMPPFLAVYVWKRTA